MGLEASSATLLGTEAHGGIRNLAWHSDVGCGLDLLYPMVHPIVPLSPLDFWEYYLPYLYSCISFLGVLLLLGECTQSEGFGDL